MSLTKIIPAQIELKPAFLCTDLIICRNLNRAKSRLNLMKKFTIMTIAVSGFVSCIITLGLSASAAVSTSSDSESAMMWRLPLLPDTNGQIHLLNPYRQPNSDYSAGHRGVDYRAPIGTAIYAANKGSVAFSGTVVDRRLITIRHESNLITEYEPVCSQLAVGDLVKPNQPIGSVCIGTPSYLWHCNEPCLHFSLRSDGAYLSPLALIGGLSPSRLLPLGRLLPET